MGIGQKLKGSLSKDHQSTGGSGGYIPPSGTHVSDRDTYDRRDEYAGTTSRHDALPERDVDDRFVMDPADKARGSNVMDTTGVAGDPVSNTTTSHDHEHSLAHHDRHHDTYDSRDQTTDRYDGSTSAATGRGGIFSSDTPRTHHDSVHQPTDVERAQRGVPHQDTNLGRHDQGLGHGSLGTGRYEQDPSYGREQNLPIGNSRDHGYTSSRHDTDRSIAAGGLQSHQILDSQDASLSTARDHHHQAPLRGEIPGHGAHDRDLGLHENQRRGDTLDQKNVDSGIGAYPQGQALQGDSIRGQAQREVGGAEHFGPGHRGAKVLHKCTNCGVDNDISRYFDKEAVYRIS